MLDIILLNGPTCSGKSTLARLLQDRLAQPYVHMPIDAFVAMLPARYSVSPGPPDRPDTVARLRHGYHAAVAAMAARGNRIIVDTVRAEPLWLGEWLEAFAPFTVLYVGVFARLDDLIRREAERARPDDIAGTAERQFHTVHADDIYDVRVNTSHLSPERCAEAVVAYRESGSEPAAFARLRVRMAEVRAQS